MSELDVPQMSQLYTFVYNRLVDANLTRNPTLIDEALQVLEHQRETWQLLMDKIRSEAMPDPAAAGSGQDGVGESLSVEG